MQGQTVSTTGEICRMEEISGRLPRVLRGKKKEKVFKEILRFSSKGGDLVKISGEGEDFHKNRVPSTKSTELRAAVRRMIPV